jgi:hypothetical protein
MSKYLLRNLGSSLFGKSRRSPAHRRQRARMLSMERLESRKMFSITPLNSISVSANAGEKPQSKIFQYNDEWFTVMPTKKGGATVFRLDGTTWTATDSISTDKKAHADVEVVGDLAYVLLYDGQKKTQFRTLQFDAAQNTFVPWATQPNLVNIPLTKGVETATIAADSTGRLWIASDAKSTIEVRYSDGLHTTWSAPITLATGISSDDISSIIAMPDGTIGVMWSNQKTQRFGFRTHVDGTDPNTWTADEVPASQSALKVGGGEADDHIHLAVESNGTLYAAVKTSYDKSPNPHIALLVRRPNGTWDNLYLVDTAGTRPVIVVDEAADQLIIAYTTKEGGGDIVYRTSPLDNISLSPRQVLIPGKVNNVTTTKTTSTNQVVFLADSKSAIFTFDTLMMAVSFASEGNLILDDPTTPSTTSTTATDIALTDPDTTDPFIALGQPLVTPIT